MPTPSLAAIWAAFPDHLRYRTLHDLYTMLGGTAARNINAPGFGPNGNTCASRLSHAFNRGGAPISEAIARRAGAETIGTANSERIIFRVTHFRSYLRAAYGEPRADTASPFDDSFRQQRGIIAFNVTGWGDATGHIALFDRGRYREPAYDNYASFSRGAAHATRGELWPMA